MMACLKRRRHSSNHQGNVCFFLNCFLFLLISFTASVSFIISMMAKNWPGYIVRGHDSYLQL